MRFKPLLLPVVMHLASKIGQSCGVNVTLFRFLPGLNTHETICRESLASRLKG